MNTANHIPTFEIPSPDGIEQTELNNWLKHNDFPINLTPEQYVLLARYTHTSPQISAKQTNLTEVFNHLELAFHHVLNNPTLDRDVIINICEICGNKIHTYLTTYLPHLSKAIPQETYKNNPAFVFAIYTAIHKTIYYTGVDKKNEIEICETLRNATKALRGGMELVLSQKTPKERPTTFFVPGFHSHN